MKQTIVLRYFLIVFVWTGLSSCSVFSPVKTEQCNTYIINKLPHPVVAHSDRKWVLLVLPVEAPSIVNTTQIAYLIPPYKIGYFVKHNWAAMPTQMLQPLIVQTLQNTHHFYSVNSVPFIGNYHYVLTTQLLTLHQTVASDRSEVYVVLRAQLINAVTKQVVAVKTFSVSQPTIVNTPESGVIATNKAVATVLKQLATFCVRAV